ncbi:hypothetical protein LJC33_01890, partial [Eubacteriales bacterium OttesenSCG-928-N13]|nr:hypothetical protein [Eubacteriales bacterium OttesenSCG-928-N13]
MGSMRGAKRTNQDVRRDVPLSDPAMMQYARTLAQTLKIDGESRLDLSELSPARLNRMDEEARLL